MFSILMRVRTGVLTLASGFASFGAARNYMLRRGWFCPDVFFVGRAL